MNIYLDYETRGEVDVRNTGSVGYAIHPSTEITCMAYKIGNRKTELWLPGQPFPLCLKKLAKDRAPVWVAHNALFEQCLTNHVLPRYGVNLKLPPHRWKCTAAKGAACAMPRSLEGLGSALGLPVQKDMDGARLIKKYFKPRIAWKKWNEAGRVGPEPQKFFNDEFELLCIYDYCATDVEVMALIDKALPDLSEYERKVWVLNQEMNLRGVTIDLKAASLIQNLIKIETKRLVRLCAKITDGVTPTQNRELMKWLNSHGLKLKNMQAETLKEVAKGTSGGVKKVITIRQAVSKASLKKYPAMIERAGALGRVTDLALYHGASTGREAGRGLQVHNLARGKHKNTDKIIDDIMTGLTLDEIAMCYGKPFEVFSSCIRGMITASPGHQLFVADYNAIEARIVMWLAGHEEGLELFRLGKDPYIKMASRIFNRPESKIGKESDERFLGKQAILGCGYNMGPGKFLNTCHNLGAKWVTLDMAKRAVKVYRESHAPVVTLWGRFEEAAITAVQTNCSTSVGRVSFFTDGKFLKMRLPSGRLLSFYNPSIKNTPTPWGELRPKLYYWRTNPVTKKWERSGTYGGSIVESACQGAARDIMVAASLRLKERGFKMLFSVHDEVVFESDELHHTLEGFLSVVKQPPKWAKGLPIAAGGWKGHRYRK